jgi:hypothetical protein
MEENPFFVEVKEKNSTSRRYLVTVNARNLSNAKFAASCHVRFILKDSLYYSYDYYPKAIES